jgi:putative addiction module component (TIGR02574 family)
MAELDDLIRRVLSLGVDERARLAERLIESLDELSEAEAAEVWATEAERRLHAYRAGEVQAIPAEQVMNDAEDMLR